MRFEFSSNWESKKLKDIIQISKEKYNPNSEKTNYKCIELEHLAQETGLLLGYTDSINQNSIKNKFHEDNILFGKLRPYLKKFYYTNFEGVCSSEIWVFNTKEHSRYIYYLIQTKRFLDISNVSSGSKMPRSDWNFMKEFTFSIPDIKTQKETASLFSMIDDKIELLEKKYRVYQDFKRYLMQEIFAQKLRFENYNEAIYKISDLYSSKKGTGLSKDKLDEEGLNKCILYGELYTTYNEIIQDVKSKTNSQEGILSKVGDILIPSSTTTKGIDLVTASVILEENVLLGGDITILRSKNENIINNKFFAYYFTNNLVKDVSKLTQGSTIIHLYWKDFKKVKIALPPINEQNKCVDLFLKLDKKIDLINFQIQKMEEFKKGLLQQMFVVQLILSLLQNKKHI